MKSLLAFFKYIFFFPFWWYFANLSFWQKFITRTLVLLADGLGFEEVARALFKPYRGDVTWIGRSIGFFIRIIWLTISTIFLLAALLTLFLLFFAYLFFPVLVLLLIFSDEYQIFGIVFFFLLSWLYSQVYIRQPKKKIAQIKAISEIEVAMTPKTREIWGRLKNQKYSPFIIFETLLRAKKLKLILKRLNLKPQELFEMLPREKTIEGAKITTPLPHPCTSPAGRDSTGRSWGKILQTGFELGKKFNFDYFDVGILFLAVVAADSKIEETFEKLGIKFEQIAGATLWVKAQIRAKESWKYWKDEFFHRRGSVDIGWTAGFLPRLKHFSIDITYLVQEGALPIFVGREREMEETIRILQQTTRNNVLLVGSPGCGKTTFVAGVAQKILEGRVKGKLAHKKVIQLDIGGMLAGTKARGELEERIGQTLSEVKGGESILFVDDMENLLTAGIEFFVPSLSAGVIQFIGTTTPKAYEELVKPQEALAVHFQTVRLRETSFEETMSILQTEVVGIEAKQKVVFSYQALEAAIALTQRYIHNRVLPAKAVSLVDETAVFVAEEFQEGLRKKKVVTAEDIAKVLSDKINVPLKELTQEETQKLLRLEKMLHQRIVNQEEAVSAVSDALRRARTGLTSQKRPIASFLFIGPTGVGKTETAKALSAVYFGSEKNMVRLDMSEYNTQDSVPKAIERLCGPVKVSPFCLLLLDEIEKAHEDVHNLLLQVLDDGRLTDASGETVDFTNTLIIGTSNAYSEYITSSIKKGKDIEEIKVILVENLTKVFRPELLNRFDGVIVFKPLGMEQVCQITRLLLAEVADKMAEQEIEVSFSGEVVTRIAQLGFDPAFGARPLRRVIQERVENLLAEKILRGELKKGSKITLTAADIH